MTPETLGDFEQIVLLAVLRLGETAYGVSIREEIAARTDRDPSPGALYTTLARLEEKGLLTSRLGAPTPDRGGRAKRFVKLTAKGAEAISRAQRAYQNLLHGIALPFPSMDKGKLAESVLSLAMEPARAASVTGDLLETGASHDVVWFWSNVLQTLVATLWCNLTGRSSSGVFRDRRLGLVISGMLLIVAGIWQILLFPE